MTPEERAVLAANDAFYSAFRDRDSAAMEALWAQDAPVACIHPGWSPLRERELIMRSWRAIFRGDPRQDIIVEDASPAVLGTVAYVICYEHLLGPGGDDAGTLVATNLFVREAGRWRIAHHQAGPVAPQEEEDDPEPPPPGMLN
ncbi:MAG: nuclear transport factor 2 family protein [Deltaproteobacteria bacterium]|nr:nuclear transport factor 2 family protein [Deltaproteobacteria bacterium]